MAAETMRRGLPALGWVWKRATRAAKDDDPRRGEQWARRRFGFEHRQPTAARFLADELDIHRLPTVGYHWMPKGEQGEVPPPGTNEQRYLAGAVEMRTGRIVQRGWWRKTHGLLLDLLQALAHADPAARFTHLQVVGDNYTMHKAEAVEQWRAAHPRVELRFLPPSCPTARPIERALGAVPDKCTRTHQRNRLWSVVKDGEPPLGVNGPWHSELSEIYSTPDVTAALQALLLAEPAPEELSQLAA